MTIQASDKRLSIPTKVGGKRWMKGVLAATVLAAATTLSIGQSTASAQGPCYEESPAGSPAPGHEEVCSDSWTAWLGGQNTKFMGALNDWNFNVVMQVVSSGYVRSVCVAPGHILWEDSSADAAGVIAVTGGIWNSAGSAVACSPAEV